MAHRTRAPSAGLGIGLVGTGFMGKCHALAFNAVAATFERLPRPRLAVLCDADAGRAAEAAAVFGFDRATADWRAVVDDPAVDLVAVATPNATHAEIAVAALAAGKHVYCEKPMALGLADAVRMAEAADEAPGLRTRLGYNYTANPALEHARRLIADGTLGRIVHARALYDEDYMADAALPWSWRCRKAEAGLGALGDIGCHAVSILHRLVGPIVRVVADVDTAHRERPLPDRPGEVGDVDNEDVAAALLRFSSGASGALATSRAAHGYKNGIRIEVQGTLGTLRFDQERMNELGLFLAAGEPALRGFRTVLTGPLHPPYGAFCPAPGHGLGFNDLKVIEVAGFLAAIADDDPYPLDFAEGLAIERVIHGIARSAEEGRWLDVAE